MAADVATGSWIRMCGGVLVYETLSFLYFIIKKPVQVPKVNVKFLQAVNNYQYTFLSEARQLKAVVFGYLSKNCFVDLEKIFDKTLA